MRSYLKPDTSKKILLTEIAWLAGFFDGEGTLGIYYGGRNGKYPCWSLAIYNTDKKSLDYCMEITGVGHVHSRKRILKEGYKRQWTWEIKRQRNIVSILKQMIPFLQIKRFIAEEMVNNWKDIDQ